MEKGRETLIKECFVQELQTPLQTYIHEFVSARYAFFEHLALEAVEITYDGGHHTYINVTGNSIESIMMEIATELLGNTPTGRMEKFNWSHAMIEEHLYEEAKESC